MKLKTKKILSKRVKVTAKKKIVMRRGGQDHFNSRESSKVTRNKKRDVSVSDANVKMMKKLLPYL